jgi:Protein of unknown function (DUF3800)
MVLSYPKPDIGIHVFIDEAGEPGHKLPKDGEIKGTNWFILGATVVNADKINQLDQWCKNIKEKCGLPVSRPIHFQRLSNENKLLACQLMAELPLRNFVFCSDKRNIRGYKNTRAASASPEKNWYYHSCVKYLLERITEFGLDFSKKTYGKAKHASIILDERADIHISKLKVYLDGECRRIESGRAFHTKRQLKTEVMNSGCIKGGKDDDHGGLQLADIVASAFFLATENAKFPRLHRIEPAKALDRIMWKGSSYRKIAANNGVTLFPAVTPSRLTPKEKLIFEHYGYGF